MEWRERESDSAVVRSIWTQAGERERMTYRSYSTADWAERQPVAPAGSFFLIDASNDTRQREKRTCIAIDYKV